MTRSNHRTGISAINSSCPASPSLSPSPSSSSSSSSSSCCSDQIAQTPPLPPPQQQQQQQQQNSHPQYDNHHQISTSSSSSSPILSPSSNSQSTVRQENAASTCRSRSRRLWRRRWWWIPVCFVLLMILWTLTATTTTTLAAYLPLSIASTTMNSAPLSDTTVVGNERSEAQQRQQQHHNLHHDLIPPQRTYRDQDQDRHPDLHVVVAYCRMSIDWIFDDFLKDFDDNHHNNFVVDENEDDRHDHQHNSRKRGKNSGNKIRQPRHYKQPLDRIKSIWIFSKCQSSKSKSGSGSGNDDSGSVSGIDEDAGTNNLNIIHERLVHFFTNRIKNKTMTSMTNEEGVVTKHPQRQIQQQIPRIIIDSSLPNVGRCDHTYAYWMFNYVLQTPPPPPSPPSSNANNTTFSLNLTDDDEVLFIKDNNNKDHVGYIQLNTFQDMEKLVYRSRRNNHEGKKGRKRRSRNRTRKDSSVEESNLQLRSTFQSNSQHGHADDQSGFGCSTRISWKGWNQRAPDMIDAATLGNFHLKDYIRDFHKTHSHSETNSSRHDGVKDVEAPNTTSDNLTAQFESPHRPLRRFVEEMKMNIDGVVMKTTTTTAAAVGTTKDPNEKHHFRDKVSLDVFTGLSSERTWLGEVLFVPICYCGSFLTTVRQIRRAPIEDWSLLLQTLSRGDNIEEGHYMERLWAALLSNPLTTEEQKTLRQQVVSWDENGTPYIDPTKWIENTQLIR